MDIRFRGYNVFPKLRGGMLKVATPVITITAGEVTITCATEGAEIWYTTDGTDPVQTTNGTEYTIPFSPAAPVTIKARAYKEGWAASSIATSEQVIPLDLDTFLTHREGLTLVDEIGDNDAEILTATYIGNNGRMQGQNTAATNTAERFFDDTDQTLYFRTTLTKAVQYSGSVSTLDSRLFTPYGMGRTGGQKGINIYTNSGNLKLVCSDGGNTQGTDFYREILIEHFDAIVLPLEYVDILVNIDATNKTLTIYIYTPSGEVLAERELDISGFTMSNNYNHGALYFSDEYWTMSNLKKFEGIKTLEQCLDNTHNTGIKYHYPMLFDRADVSGNAHHLDFHPAGGSIVYTKGNPYLLDYGYVLYKGKHHDEYGGGYSHEWYMPRMANGNSLGFGREGSRTKTVDGIPDGINLADCRIRFKDDFFDRSNSTIWNNSARGGIVDAVENPMLLRKARQYEGYYNANDPKSFHISELNQATLQKMLNDGYKGRLFVKCNENSITDYWNYSDRHELLEILLYNTNKTLTDGVDILKYTGDDFAIVRDISNNPEYTAANEVQVGELETTKPMFMVRMDDGLSSQGYFITPFAERPAGAVVGELAIICGNDPDRCGEAGDGLLWSTILEMYNAGWEVSAHGMVNATSPDLTYDEWEEVCQDCISILEDRTGITPDLYCPHGSSGQSMTLRYLVTKYYKLGTVGFPTSKYYPCMNNPRGIDLFAFSGTGGDMYTAYDIETVDGANRTKILIDAAAKSNSLVQCTIHGYTAGKLAALMDFFDYCDLHGVDIVTSRDILENLAPRIRSDYKMKFLSNQPSTPANVSLTYNIEDGYHVWIDWGDVAWGTDPTPALLTADGTDQTVTKSDYAGGATYTIRLFGDIDKITKFEVDNTTVEISRRETDRFTGITTLTLGVNCTVVDDVVTAPSTLALDSITGTYVDLTWDNQGVVDSVVEVWLAEGNAIDTPFRLIFTDDSTRESLRYYYNPYRENEKMIFKVRHRRANEHTDWSNAIEIGFGSNLLSNMGTAETTDWIDTNEDGLADGLVLVSNWTPSIIDGTTASERGFEGRAQRGDTTGSNARIDTTSRPPVEAGKKYLFTFKGRSDGTVQAYCGEYTTGARIITTTLSAVRAEYKGVLWDGNDVTTIPFRFLVTLTNKFVEIDEVCLQEIILPV